MADNVADRRARPVSIAERPMYALLLPIPIVCFLGAVLTDLSYLGSGGHLLWLHFSSWLLTAGLVFGSLALVALLVEAVRLRGGWPALILLAVTWVAELINAFVHTRDGWTAVDPLGLILSIIGALFALAAGWFSASLRRWSERP